MEHHTTHSAPLTHPLCVLQSWNSELYPGRKAPEHVGEARRPGMKHVALWGEGGGLPDKHLSVGMTTGKVFMCLFVFVKRKSWKDRKNTFYIWIFTNKDGYYNGICPVPSSLLWTERLCVMGLGCGPSTWVPGPAASSASPGSLLARRTQSRGPAVGFNELSR